MSAWVCVQSRSGAIQTRERGIKTEKETVLKPVLTYIFIPKTVQVLPVASVECPVLNAVERCRTRCDEDPLDSGFHSINIQSGGSSRYA